MNLRIAHINHPLRLLFDAPYIDGIKNIKAALQLERISHAAERGIEAQHSSIDLSKRCVQFAIGGVLLIPGINIVIDLAMRLLNRTADLQGNYRPSSQVISPSLIDEIVLENILPRVLEFLEENDYPEASVKYHLQNENLKFDFHLKDNADLSIVIPYPAIPIPSVLPLYVAGETTASGIFAELKKKIIFYHKGIEDRGYLRDFVSNPFTSEFPGINNMDNFNDWMTLNITPNILQLMRNIGLENPQFSYEANQRDRIGEFDVRIKLICNSKEFARFHKTINGSPYISLPLFVKMIIHEIILNKNSL
jgi:hypothetical protein